MPVKGSKASKKASSPLKKKRGRGSGRLSGALKGEAALSVNCHVVLPKTFHPSRINCIAGGRGGTYIVARDHSCQIAHSRYKHLVIDTINVGAKVAAEANGHFWIGNKSGVLRWNRHDVSNNRRCKFLHCVVVVVAYSLPFFPFLSSSPFSLLPLTQLTPPSHPVPDPQRSLGPLLSHPDPTCIMSPEEMPWALFICGEAGMTVYDCRDLSMLDRMVVEGGLEVCCWMGGASNNGAGAAAASANFYTGNKDGIIRSYAYRLICDGVAAALQEGTDEAASKGVPLEGRVKLARRQLGRYSGIEGAAITAIGGSQDRLYVGDSQGFVSVLDRETMASVFRVKVCETSVLRCIEFKGDIYVAGDRIVVLSDKSSGHWGMVNSYRNHTGGATGLCALPDAVVSGGRDGKLCLIGKADRPTNLMPLPDSGNVSVGGGGGLLAVTFNADEGPQSGSGFKIFGCRGEGLLGTLVVNKDHGSGYYPLRFVAISWDCKFAICGDYVECKAFKLNYGKDGSLEGTERIKLPEAVVGGCSCAEFCRDSRRAAMCMDDGSLVVCDVNDSVEGDDVTADLVASYGALPDKDGKTSIGNGVSISMDARWVAIKKDVEGSQVEVYDLEGNDAEPYWVLPKLESWVTAIRFYCNPEGEEDESASRLTVCCVNNTFYCLDIENKKYGEYTRQLGIPVAESMPKELSGVKEYPFMVTYDPNKKANQFIMVRISILLGFAWLCLAWLCLALLCFALHFFFLSNFARKFAAVVSSLS